MKSLMTKTCDTRAGWMYRAVVDTIMRAFGRGPGMRFRQALESAVVDFQGGWKGWGKRLWIIHVEKRL